MYYYTINESEDIIDLILIEDNITEAMKGDDKRYPIIVELEENSILSESETKMISDNLKGKFLDKAHS